MAQQFIGAGRLHAAGRARRACVTMHGVHGVHGHSRPPCGRSIQSLDPMSFVSELQRELVLISLARSGEEGLRLVRHESGEVPRDPPVGRSGWDVLSLPSISIPTSTYEIFFASVPAYCVTLEQHPVQDAQEVSEGTQFRRYKSSRFLEFHTSSCHGDDLYPGPRFHFGIYCRNGRFKRRPFNCSARPERCIWGLAIQGDA